MRNIRNPIRRNRNIGTSKQGYGNNNKLIIPRKYHDSKVFWEDLIDYHVVSRNINKQEITYLIEPTKDNYKYYCSVEDIAYLLSFVPEDDISLIDLIIFRQSKTKEEILNPAWGRLAHWVNIGRFSGTAIIIEAQNINKPIYWNKSLNPYKLNELQTLERDGHKITQNTREFIIKSCSDSVRTTQLYRTLFHEIGHWVQYMNMVLDIDIDIDIEEIDFEDDSSDLYDKLPQIEKERFADKYANSMIKRLMDSGIIPFPKKPFLFEDKLINSYFD